jgi:DNA repair exonuclease SbcCD ATPase subunit
MSFGNQTTVIQLDRPGTTLIVGEDLDNTSNGQGANGVGKTTIVNALAYAMYDKPVSNISKDNLVNNINKKNMEVTVTFENDGIFYMIRRVRKSKSYAAGNYVELYEKLGSQDFTKDDEITPDSVGNTNRKIVDIVGIPYDLFVRIVVFSATHVPFLDLPVRHVTAANQTGIVEELFDITTLSEKAELLKSQIKISEQEIGTKKTRIVSLEKEHLRHTEQIKSAKRRVIAWENTNTKDIENLEAKLRKVDNVDIEGQRKLHNKLTEVEQELNASLETQRKIEKGITASANKQAAIEEELEHLRDQKCPYCLQKYEDAEQKINENVQLVEESIKLIEELSDGLDTMDVQVSKLTKKHKLTKNKITVANLEELLEIKNQSATIAAKLEELKNATNPFIESLDELEEIQLENIGYDEVNELTKHIDHQKFLLKLLTKKDSFVRKVLLNKNIPFLNSRLQEYLTDLGLPHTVEFTHQLTAEISQFGRPMDFGNLSNGQRARVNIALSFAFRDVLQNLHTRINVCLLDEVLDVGLDAVGVQNAARMLKRKSRDENLSLYIISHRDEIDSAFENTMTVQMTKGFSYIKED